MSILSTLYIIKIVYKPHTFHLTVVNAYTKNVTGTFYFKDVWKCLKKFTRIISKMITLRENSTFNFEKMKVLNILLCIVATSSKTLSSREYGGESFMRTCTETGLQCKPCVRCFPGGWCTLSSQNKKQCICMYGWTGDSALYLPDTNSTTWGKNRILANDCKTPCHYTHEIRNYTCTKPQNSPNQCHPSCLSMTGVCMSNGMCRCNRGWSGPNGNYNRTLDRYIATYCDKECPYLGYGIQNPGCAKKLLDIPACNPLCSRNDGRCLQDIGRCLCSLGWTGPNSQYGDGVYRGRILADHCLIYCPYTEEKRNDLCLNPDYVQRLQFAGHIA